MAKNSLHPRPQSWAIKVLLKVCNNFPEQIRVLNNLFCQDISFPNPFKSNGPFQDNTEEMQSNLKLLDQKYYKRVLRKRRKRTF